MKVNSMKQLQRHRTTALVVVATVATASCLLCWPVSGSSADDAATPEPPAAGFLGLSLRRPSRDEAQTLDQETRVSVVRKSLPGSPASAAGLRGGDIIIGHDGSVADSDPSILVRRFRSSPPGTKYQFVVLRDGERRTVTVVAVKRDLVTDSAAAVERACTWLVSRQLEVGAWREFDVETTVPSAAVTALVLRCGAQVAPSHRGPLGPAMERGASWLINRMGPEGAVLATDDGVSYRQHATALALHGLALLDPERHGDAMSRMASFLRSQQASEETGFHRYRLEYGGFNYLDLLSPDTFRADVSLISMVTEALEISGLEPQSPVMRRARRFLTRCQNRPRASGPNAGHAVFDGGFTAQPDGGKSGVEELESFDFVFRSYGSATADGLRALIATGHALDSPAVSVARDWLHRNWTLRHNPALRDPSQFHYDRAIFFYYLFSVCEALARTSRDGWLKSSQGVPIDWASSMATFLITKQSAQGSWKNPVPAMHEDDPDIATSFAVIALERCRRALAARRERE